MPANLHKTPEEWASDTMQSVAMFNTWFMQFAPQTFREQRALTADRVEQAFVWIWEHRIEDLALLGV